MWISLPALSLATRGLGPASASDRPAALFGFRRLAPGVCPAFRAGMRSSGVPEHHNDALQRLATIRVEITSEVRVSLDTRES